MSSVEFPLRTFRFFCSVAGFIGFTKKPSGDAAVSPPLERRFILLRDSNRPLREDAGGIKLVDAAKNLFGGDNGY